MKKQSSPPEPPRLGRWILHRCIRPELIDYLAGDLEEMFSTTCEERGVAPARRKYLGQVLRLLRPRLLRPFRIANLNTNPMNHIRSSLLSTFRQARNQPFRTGIQLLGLLISFSCALLIGLHLAFHLSFDQHVPEADRIYRMAVDRNYLSGEKQSFATSSFPLAEVLASELASVEEVTQFISSQLMHEKMMLSARDTRHYEARIIYADPNLPAFLGLNFTQPQAPARLEGYSAYLSESTAARYFGDDDPLGQLLLLGDTLAVKVQGVYRDLPANSHLRLPLLLSMEVFEAVAGSRARTIWGWDLAYTYVRLAPGTDPASPMAQFDDIFAKYTPNFAAKRGYVYTAELQPLRDIHLHSHRLWELVPGENPANLYLLAGACLLLLLISTVNFVNLMSAQVYRQTKAIGMKKVLGATPLSLFVHFVVEVGLQLLLVLLLSGVVVYSLIPTLSSFTGILPKDYLSTAAGTVSAGALLVALLFLLITTARLYLLVRPVKPSVLLNRHAASAYRLGAFSKGLLLFQFAIAIFLTLGASTLYQQLELLQSHSLGFSKEHTLIFSLDEGEIPRLDALKNAVENQAGIQSVSATSAYPGGRSERMRMRTQGQEEFVPVNLLFVDYDFLQTLQIPLVEGRGFDREYATDSTIRFIVNRAARTAFGIDLGTNPRLEWPTINGTYRGDVIGVMEDFHFASLTQSIEPMVLVVFPRYNYLLVRTSPGQVPATLTRIEQAFRSIIPEQTFHYQWLEQSLADQYQREARLSSLVRIFTGLAFLIALVGLIALTDILIDNRVKEMGIRKVLGASAWQIILLINRQFIYLLLLAVLVAIPAALFFTDSWLEQYVYRVSVRGETVVMICGASLLLILGTVSLKSLRAARENPVKALRRE